MLFQRGEYLPSSSCGGEHRLQIGHWQRSTAVTCIERRELCRRSVPVCSHFLSLSVCLSRSPPLSVFVSLSVNGLDLSALDSGFNAVISNNILYALPVYCGYLTQGHKEMLQRIFERANRRGFTVHEYDLAALVRMMSTIYFIIVVPQTTV